MPRNVHKSNPINVLPEKNRKIFTDVIPTIRKIQEQKYFSEISKESERKKRNNSLVKRACRLIGGDNLKSLSERTRRAVKNQMYENFDKLEGDIGIEQIRKIKQSALSLILKIKRTQKQLLTKKEARDRIITEEVLYYDKLKPEHKAQLNNLIKYNLALINQQTHISFEEYLSLREKVFSELNHFPIDYVNIMLAREEILLNPITKRKLAEMSAIEKAKLLKYLNRELKQVGPRIYKGNNFEKINTSFIRKILFG